MQRFTASRPRAAWPVRLLAVLAALTACRNAPAPTPPPAPADRSERADDGDAGPDIAGLDPSGEGAADPPAQAPARRPAPTPVHALPDAIKALEAGNFEGAATFLGDALRKQPGDEKLRLAAAHALLATGAYDQAEALLAEPRPAPSAARLRLHARLRLLRGDPARAEALLVQATTDPAELPARGELLALMVATGRSKDAKAVALREALYDAYDAGKAKTAEQLVAVARAALARGTTGAFHDANMVLGEAERLPQETASLEPGFLVRDRVLLLRGAMFREKYAASDAVATYEQILQRDAWQPDALAGVAAAYLEELRLAAAADAAARALQVNPRHPDALAVLARISLVEGRRDEATTRAQSELLAVATNHPEGLAVLAGAALARDDRPAYVKLRDQALAANPTGAPFFLALSDLLVSMHLYEQAGAVLEEAVGRAPDNAYVQSAHGLNLLRLGREPQGRAALKEAWKRDRFNERTRNTLDLYEQRIDPLYTDITQGDLSVRLLKEDQEYVSKDILDVIARARAAMDKRYGLRPGPLRIEVFADPRDFSVRTIGVPSLGAVGVCFGNLITSVGPYGGTHNFHQVIWHELAHVYAVQLSKGRVPRWFTEGLSEWESELADPSWARESAELLAAARRQNKLRRLSELELAFLRAGSAQMMEVAYTTAAYAMRYLGETYGLPKLVAMLKGYGEGETTEALFKRHLGKDLAVVEREFETWLYGQLDARVRGWEAGRPGPGDERDKLFSRAISQLKQKDLTAAARTLQQLIQGRGDGFAPRMALAEALMSGPSWKSAAEHFKKAREFRPEAVEPLIRLAEVARREGDVAREKQLLRDGMAIDGMSYDPAARLLMLAAVTGDDPAFAYALDRATAIAPLHPLTLAGQSLRAGKAGDRPRAQALSKRSVRDMNDGPLARGPVDTIVVLALAAEAAGDATTAKILATRANAETGLPAPAKQAMQRIVQAKPK